MSWVLNNLKQHFWMVHIGSSVLSWSSSSNNKIFEFFRSLCFLDQLSLSSLFFRVSIVRVRHFRKEDLQLSQKKKTQFLVSKGNKANIPEPAPKPLISWITWLVTTDFIAPPTQATQSEVTRAKGNFFLLFVCLFVCSTTKKQWR